MAKRKTTDQVQIKIRIRESLRSKLEQSAKKNLESLNREIIDRLERSFDRQDLLVEALSLTYGDRLAGILILVGRAMKDAGRQGAFAADIRGNTDDWMRVPYAYREALQAAMVALGAFRPAGELKGPSESYLEIFKGVPKDIGMHIGANLVEAVKTKAPPDLRAWASTVRRLVQELEDEEAK